MSEEIPNLWSEDIRVDVLSPIAILRTQAALLRRLTSGVLGCEVATSHSKEHMLHQFEVIAPALNSYRLELFTVQHKQEHVYPASVRAECFSIFNFAASAPPSIGARHDGLSSLCTAATQDELIENIGFVLHSSQVRSAISSLLARSNEQQYRPVMTGELESLPRWARVAFAVRCVRYGQKELAKLGLNPSAGLMAVFDQALNLAQDSSSKATPADGLQDLLKTCEQRESAAIGAAGRAEGSPPRVVPVGNIVKSLVAVGATAAARSVFDDTLNSPFKACQQTFYIGEQIGSNHLALAIREDLFRIQAASAKNQWTKDTPVPTNFFDEAESKHEPEQE